MNKSIIVHYKSIYEFWKPLIQDYSDIIILHNLGIEENMLENSYLRRLFDFQAKLAQKYGKNSS